jgi:hypothetical protein
MEAIKDEALHAPYRRHRCEIDQRIAVLLLTSAAPSRCELANSTDPCRA